MFFPTTGNYDKLGSFNLACAKLLAHIITPQNFSPIGGAV